MTAKQIPASTIVTLRSDKNDKRWVVEGLDPDGYYRLIRINTIPSPYTRHKARPDNLQRVDTP